MAQGADLAVQYYKKLEEDKIVGDVIDKFSPKVELEIVYGSTPVLPAGALRKAGTQDSPIVRLGAGSEDSAFYALLLVDPDAPDPSNPQMREYAHWIVLNIPGNFDSQTLEELNVVLDYKGPAPREGRHRYVFVLYKQEVEKIERIGFKARQFAKEKNLGEPVAATFFFAEKDEGPAV
eukprot:jgi/Mesen1/6600/ME000338S05782